VQAVGVPVRWGVADPDDVKDHIVTLTRAAANSRHK
jgi:hypothetical protein